MTAIGLVCEIGDLERFEHPRQRMGCLGLVPSKRSSGERTHRGSITKPGNAHARRLLTEAVRTMAWKAQLRLAQRFKALRERGVQANKACFAVARELAGFIWAIARQAQAEQTR